MRLKGLKEVISHGYRKKTFEFCGSACQTRFVANPEKFLGTPLIRLENVKKIFRTGAVETTVIRGFDLNVWEGDFVVIIGASGSGKSTLLNLIGLLDRPSTGRVFIKDKDADSLSEDARAMLRSRTFGFIFQQYNLIPWLTAYENAVLPLIFAGQTANRSATELLFNNVGLSGRLGHRPTQLSGGEQQRVALVRALINNPAIVLGDEPTGNLDSQTGTKILQTLITLHRKEKKTLVVVSHDARIAESADQIITIQDGLPVPSRPKLRTFSRKI
ncbi:MAG: ABC transporter ATP-binding protein [Patescibacteria group bacterium]|jgi:ABC-type lipoprotein export system ATPase subunit